MLCVSNIFSVVVSAILFLNLTDVQSLYVRDAETNRSVVHKKVIATGDEAKRRCEAEGYTHLSGSYYKLHKEPETFGEAREICSAEGGYLAVINNEREANDVLELAYDKGIYDWIWIFTEIRHREENSNWRSVLGYPLNQLFTRSDRYIDMNDLNCASLNKEGNIVNVNCAWHLSYVCENNQSTTGYTYLSGHYYKLHKKPASWDEAQQTCAAEGGYLAVINNAREAHTIIKFGSSNNEGLQIHTGLRRKKYGLWENVLGAPLHLIYNRWSDTHTFNCLQKKGDSFDVKCTWDLPYLCEKQC